MKSITRNNAAHPVAVYGHRGARAILPENSLAGFEYAISIGVDAIEFDVAVTRDDVLVISHDPKLKRRNIRDLTASQTLLPTLDQVLDLAARRTFIFNIEVKSYPRQPNLSPPPEQFAGMVLAAIRRHNLDQRVLVSSFDFRVLHAVARLAPEIPTGALYMGRPKSLLKIARESGAQTVLPYHPLASSRQIAAAHNAGLKVIAWTANRPSDWRRLIAARVDGIVTDNPAALIAFLLSA